jgi:signal transduction histidine kinase
MNIDTGISSSLIFSECGVVLEILFFSTGLAFKNKLVEQQKIQGQQELIKQYRAHAALQERVQTIRNNIAQDLHDDIGSTLSSIAILSELIMRENKESATIEIMRDIKDNSQLLMEKMDDIVWSVNPKNDPFDELLIRVKNFAAKLFEAAQIDYEITIADDIAGIELPLEYRQHIYLIIKEAVNNLVKYSGAKLAFIEIIKSDSALKILIKDNGKGFDKNAQMQGNGMRNMKNRAELMNSKLCIDTDEGTALSLTIKIK